MLSARISNTTRKAVYYRDHYRCALCDSTKYIQVHHAIPRSLGGSNDVQNLVTLCSTCHAMAHGMRFPETPLWLLDYDVKQAIIEYLSDYYAPDWYPLKE